MPDLTSPRSILMIRPSALGDVARSVPVLVSLRDAFPRARIDWLVQDSFREAVQFHPGLSNAIPFPRKDLARWYRPWCWGRLRAWLAGLRRPGYDLVLDCQGLLRSGLLTAWTRSPVRVGWRHAREGASWCYTTLVDSDPERHTVERMLDLAAAAGAPPRRDPRAQRLEPGPAATAWVGDKMGVGRRFVVLAPTSRWAAKQWPADRFAAVAASLASEGWTVVLVGGESERTQIGPLIDLASRDPNLVDLLGRTSVSQLIALIDASALVIGNDSAALHIGVAQGRPLVGLYGPTHLSRVGPYQRESDAIQHVTPRDRLDHKDPAGAALMGRIGVDEVIARARAALARAG